MAELAYSALYYPHTTIKSERLLKASLLLWDQVECIVPRGQMTPRRHSREIAEALELIVKPHIPSSTVKQKVHQRVTEFLKDGPPPWIRAYATPGGDGGHYLMYADKLFDETWEFLARHQLAAQSSEDRDYAVPSALGLLILAMLADECAGSTRTKVTDRENAYSWLFGVMTTELGGEYLPALDASHLAASFDRLITASVRIVDTDPIPLRRLVHLRKSQDSALRPIRIKYLESVAAQVKAMVAPNLTPGDRAEQLRVFEAGMQDDFRALKKELGLAAQEAIFSKEIGVCALAVAGAVLAPASIPAVAVGLKTLGVGALLQTRAKYAKARGKALSEHAMSWLYTAAGPQLV